MVVSGSEVVSVEEEDAEDNMEEDEAEEMSWQCGGCMLHVCCV